MPGQEAAGLAAKRVVVLPDVYVDTFVPVPSSQGFLDACLEAWRRGGGAVPVAGPQVRVGGNAGNLAVALASLGARVVVVGVCAPEGRELLLRETRGLDVDVSCLVDETPGPRTTALESPEGNVMLTHAGGVATYGPEQVPEAAWRRIAEADAVAVLNWSQDLAGTPLLEAVAQRVAPGAILYVDTGDPHARAGGLLGPQASAPHAPLAVGSEAGTAAPPQTAASAGNGSARGAMDAAVSELLASAAWARVDVWGMNDVEACCYGGEDGGPSAAARRIARRLGVCVDLHDATGALSIDGATETYVACPPRTPLRRTGAGDAWNAGNLAGHLLGLAAQERLALAHATAGHAVSSPDGRPARPHEVGLRTP